MYVMPPRPPKNHEKLELEREKAARHLLAKGTPPEVVAKKVGLSVEQVRGLEIVPT